MKLLSELAEKGKASHAAPGAGRGDVSAAFQAAGRACGVGASGFGAPRTLHIVCFAASRARVALLRAPERRVPGGG